MSADPFHDKLLSIVLTLPGAYEDRPWGSVHCKVAGKIFVGWSRDDAGEMQLGFRASRDLQSMLVASDPRFSVAKYVGQYGGTDMKLGKRPNWDEVEQFIVESYRLIAPKKLVKELDARLGTAAAAPKPERAKKTAAKPAKKTAAKPAKKTAAKPGRRPPPSPRSARRRASDRSRGGEPPTRGDPRSRQAAARSGRVRGRLYRLAWRYHPPRRDSTAVLGSNRCRPGCQLDQTAGLVELTPTNAFTPRPHPGSRCRARLPPRRSPAREQR